MGVAYECNVVVVVRHSFVHSSSCILVFAFVSAKIARF